MVRTKDKLWRGGAKLTHVGDPKDSAAVLMGKLLVYMAGKIGKNDWRHQIFTDLRYAENGFEMSKVDGFHYCGPYFIKCDHGCYHGENSHGRGLVSTGCRGGIDEYNGQEPARQTRYTVLNKCLNGIYSSSVLFAWIDSHDAYGTIAEIGYAVGIGKPVFVALSNGLEDPDSMWFPCRLANYTYNCDTAEEAWKQFIDVFDKKERKFRK
ncbi:hypothetical protein ACP26L_06690 [Paenibacillus sp. S-38]|uniref:hypothetical protein n=1 Tax=Paenibacillus sp. S-38 TaxID=3416710 RepID=UPI003CEA6F8E